MNVNRYGRIDILSCLFKCSLLTVLLHTPLLQPGAGTIKADNSAGQRRGRTTSAQCAFVLGTYHQHLTF